MSAKAHLAQRFPLWQPRTRSADQAQRAACRTAAALVLVAALIATPATPAGAVGICGGGPGTTKPMSLKITVELHWWAATPAPSEFDYLVTGPRSFEGTIDIVGHLGSVTLNGLKRGTYTVSVSSPLTGPPPPVELVVVPPACGFAAYFDIIVEPW